MSNDLISRSALLKEINSYIFDGVNPDTRRGEHSAKAHICELIDKQPTVDVTNRAVGKIEAKILEIKDQLMHTFDEDMAVRLRCKMHGLEEAVETVKAGGVNE